MPIIEPKVGDTVYSLPDYPMWETTEPTISKHTIVAISAGGNIATAYVPIYGQLSGERPAYDKPGTYYATHDEAVRAYLNLARCVVDDSQKAHDRLLAKLAQIEATFYEVTGKIIA